MTSSGRSRPRSEGRKREGAEKNAPAAPARCPWPEGPPPEHVVLHRDEAPTVKVACPGCGGQKSKRAKLCAECRRRANAVGADVVTHVGEAAIPPESRPPRPRTPQQNLVYHARITDLAKLTDPPSKETLRVLERQLKKAALEKARQLFGREITSSTELTEAEMEQLLEWLDEQLDKARRDVDQHHAVSA